MLVIDAPRTDGGAETLAEFFRQFQLLYNNSPLRAIKLFLLYLDSHGLDPVARCMASLATEGGIYVSLLLETDHACADSLSSEAAARTLPLLLDLDSQFLLKFAKNVGNLKKPEAILHALYLVPGLVDYSILIPWLRSLCEHSDVKVRSRAVKLLCQLRPNKGMIHHYLQSQDPRVRAGVMEALWNPKALRADHDLLGFLKSALSDSNHRVVVNALVGLYRLGETESLQKMLAMCSNKQHLSRAATAWGMGEVEDSRAIPALRQLTQDRSFTVRQRASSSLLILASLIKEAGIHTSQYDQHPHPKPEIARS